MTRDAPHGTTTVDVALGQAPALSLHAQAGGGSAEAGPGLARLDVVIPRHFAAVGNRREHHFARARRTRGEVAAVLDVLAGQAPPELPVTVELHRIDWNSLDPDGWVGALKSAIDAIARWLAVGDRDPRLHWRISQAITREKRTATRGPWRNVSEPAAELRIGIRPWTARDGRDPLRVLPTPNPKRLPSRRKNPT